MIRLLLVELEPDDIETLTLARALRDRGVEVVYAKAGTAEEIARAAEQEDVRAVGLVVRSDEHRLIGTELAARTVVFATAEDDEHAMRMAGVKAIFRPGNADHVVSWASSLTRDHER
ncbi:NAD-binding protein [Kibdelosporangium persicum]|uniref:Methylmalonyl-CoA mutase cobalamin-binding domain/chain n=1 Tax=Kibdelosporangium persicum TaxID=2698649 RepID=A0ABX2F0T9_9PSEU|nr:NAD-binding protein [Kibdelosporangium persicum]NRN64606.1 Methylmalonyl-CoA mutase cobalamin-binding domain/chain [Kibdelosporangium persicum]